MKYEVKNGEMIKYEISPDEGLIAFIDDKSRIGFLSLEREQKALNIALSMGVGKHKVVVGYTPFHSCSGPSWSHSVWEREDFVLCSVLPY